MPRRHSIAVLVLAALVANGAAQAEEMRVEANGRGWKITPIDFSDGRRSVIVVPEAADPIVPPPTTPGTAPAMPAGEPQEADAVAAVAVYVKQAGRDCVVDGVLHAVGGTITGSSPGWAGSLRCK